MESFSEKKVFRTILMIEQKGMTFDHDFCYSFSFYSSLFFMREEKRGKPTSWSKVMPFCSIISHLRTPMNIGVMNYFSLKRVPSKYYLSQWIILKLYWKIYIWTNRIALSDPKHEKLYLYNLHLIFIRFYATKNVLWYFGKTGLNRPCL